MILLILSIILMIAIISGLIFAYFTVLVEEEQVEVSEDGSKRIVNVLVRRKIFIGYYHYQYYHM